jgi:lysophospholipid acyltransferase (LPLAT)-like uncharacterized protein
MQWFLRKFVLGFLVWFVYRAISCTWKLTLDEPEEMKRLMNMGQPFILAHWHGDELVLLSLTRRYRIATITSTSKDGEMMNTVLYLMGASTSRGSSTRGGANALKGLIRIFKNENRSTSFAVDGPKGPVYEIKPGVFEFSRLTNGSIFCGGVCCDRKWEFPKSWNKTFLPKPFAKIAVTWVGPIGPVSKEQDPRSQVLADQTKDALQKARTLAVKKMDAGASLI